MGPKTGDLYPCKNEEHTHTHTHTHGRGPVMMEADIGVMQLQAKGSSNHQK